MRVKVRFRFNAVTGEVEAFQVDDLRDGPRLADHDARHDRATAEIARVVEANALIEEVGPGDGTVTTSTARTSAEPETPDAERERGRE